MGSGRGPHGPGVTRFWPWAVERYARPGAEEALLALQDRFGVSIPLALWAMWLDERGRDGDVEAALALSERWTPAIEALRTARRALKPQAPAVKDADRKALRRRVKALELEAERLLMLALERHVLATPPSEAVLPRLLSAMVDGDRLAERA